MCPYCSRKFEGFTKHQVEYYLKHHNISKHLDKVKFEEKEVTENGSSL